MARAQLRLTITSYKGLPPLHPESALFDERGGTVGRLSGNHLVLADPERFVSRTHGEIKFENGGFTYTDTSAGGTYIVSRDRLLQHGTVPLADGERLRIGEFEIAAELIGAEPVLAQPQPSPGAFDLPDQDPFGFEPSLVPAPEDRFRGVQGSVPFADNPPETPLMAPSASFIDQPDVGPQHENFALPDVDARLSPPSAAAPSVPLFDPSELLQEFEEFPAPSGSNQAPEGGFEFPDHLFQPEPSAEPEPAPLTAAVPDHVELIPLTPSAQPAGPEPNPIEPVAPMFPDLAAVAPTHVAEPVAAPEIYPSYSVSPQSSQPMPSSESPQHPVPVADHSVLFRAFLAGAGVADMPLPPPEQLEARCQLLGALFRNMAEGLMMMLRARAEMKGQWRVSVTTMRPVDNNPLQFSAQVEDALKIMLEGSHPGYLDPAVAVREAVEGLMKHQLAMTAGIQAALTALLREFDPDRYERQFEEGIVFQKKAKCWDAYVKAYSRLTAEALENFFGDDFAEAYERQVRALAKKT